MDSKSKQPGKEDPTAGVVPALGIDALRELALNLHWSWCHAADALWEALDGYLWELSLIHI